MIETRYSSPTMIATRIRHKGPDALVPQNNMYVLVVYAQSPLRRISKHDAKDYKNESPMK